jgi:hypothetical protein
MANDVNLKSNKKGERRGGRQAGTPNKNTRILKDALLDAALALGFPKEVAELDQDGKPTGAIKMLKTGFDGMQG